MLPIIEILITLQHCDKRLITVKNEILNIPREKFLLEKDLNQSRDSLEKVVSDKKQVEVERKLLDLEIKSKEAQIASYKKQQNETRKNDEYLLLNNAIQESLNTISTIEEKILILLEKLDELDLQKILLLEQLSQKEKIFIEKNNFISNRMSNLEKQKQELELERSLLIIKIDDNILNQYQSLFHTKRGIVLATIENGVCSGCHLSINPQTALNVHLENTISYCPQCNRILYEPQ